MSEENKLRWPLMHMIHDTNHTQVKRVGSFTPFIKSTIDATTLTGYESGKQWTELTPGLYKIVIDSKTYIFDIYMNISGITNFLEIDSYNKAFMRIALKDYPVILYEIDTVFGPGESIYTITDAVNSWFDMIYVGGYTELSSDSPTIDNPRKLNSVASLNFQVYCNGKATENVTMNLRNYIKSIGDLHDSCIINAEFQKYHLIIRIGRTIFSGYEQWEELESYSTDEYSVFFYPNTNVVLDTGTSTIQCTHLPTVTSNVLLATGTKYNCIATCIHSSIGQGFLMRVSNDLLNYVSNESHVSHFQDWLNSIFTSGNAMVVEYKLAEPDYREFLLEEYHLPTYQGYTIIKLNTDGCDFSYFYKSL